MEYYLSSKDREMRREREIDVKKEREGGRKKKERKR
jgi:hypothetical protein